MKAAPVQDKDKKPSAGGYIILLITGLLIYFLFTQQEQPIMNLPYSEFKDQVKQGNVSTVVMEENQIKGSLNKPIQPPAVDVLDEGSAVPTRADTTQKFDNFKTILPPIEDNKLFSLLEDNNVRVIGKSSQPSMLMSVFLNLLPWVLIIGFFVWSSRKFSKSMGGMKPGSGLLGGKEKRYKVSDNSLVFKDVAGVDNAKADLKEIVDFLKNPEKYKKIGAKLPKGVLLMGPPGTGKTLLAKATAGEANVPFFSISGSEFIELYVGMGASRVRSLFEKAKAEAPAIIFIDEIDSIGRARGTGVGGGHDEREQTLNQILSEMDGFTTHEPVVVIAATNRPDVLDSALVRPGRFDRQIVLELPLKGARQRILKIHASKIPISKDVDLEKIAHGTVGFSGADLANLVNEAALFSARDNRSEVEEIDFEKARDKVLMGNPREEVFDEKEKEIIAVHESGHALVALLTPESDDVRKITIIPRGRALGFTEQVSQEDRFNLKKSYIMGKIAILLGGRIAEEIIFGDITTGAEDDLKKATQLARRMISRWGMSEKVGYMSLPQEEEHQFLGSTISNPRDFSEKTAELVDQEIKNLLEERRNFVTNLLLNNKDKLVSLSDTLIKNEVLNQSEVRDIVFKEGETLGPSPEPRPTAH